MPAGMLLYDLDAVTSLHLAVACQAFGTTSGAVALVSILPAIIAGCVVGGVVFPVEGALVRALFGPVSCATGACAPLTPLLARRASSRVIKLVFGVVELGHGLMFTYLYGR